MATKQFKAESKRLLDMMINSIYTHKEIFLRELISNASDAMDKLYYRSLQENLTGITRDDLTIDLTVDKANRLLTVEDNGIGMTKEELESNLGTIAKSGSFAFKKENEQKDDVDIIGQFGVGFYSAFMVADCVTVVSRAFGSDEAYCWKSKGAAGYTVEPAEKDSHGTKVILHIKESTAEENYDEFLEQYRIEEIVKKYSDYIRYPIRMEMEKTRVKEGTDGEDKKPEYETYTELTTLNSMVPLWKKNKNEITPEEYNAFYKAKFNDYTDPLRVIHSSTEGAATYNALLFIPATAPFNYYTREYEKGLQLYASGVLIMDKCADLLPDHFSFVKGLVDSQDLSLNISREMLQHDRQLKVIGNSLEKKLRADLEKLLRDDREGYEKFYENFGRAIGFGIAGPDGLSRKEALQDLLLFYSSTEKKLVTLREYVDRMPESQKYIYYAAGENVSAIDHLPQTELLKDKNYEILYLTGETDEFVLQMLGKYADKEFRSIVDGELDLGDEEQKDIDEKPELMQFVKETLGDKIKEARASRRLKTHPVCMTAGEGLSFEMEKYFKRLNPEMGMKAGRILELNPNHRLFGLLQVAVAQDEEKAKKISKILYVQALLMADLPLENPGEYTDLVCELVQ